MSKRDRVDEEKFSELIAKADLAFLLKRYDDAFHFYSCAEHEIIQKSILHNGHVYFRFGVLHKNGFGKLKPDPEKALHYFKIALVHILAGVAKGDLEAQCDLGYMHSFGCGVEQSKKDAAQYYKLAADNGFARAQHNLAHMYDTGDGVTKDRGKAIQYYKLAADQGYISAQYNLGYMYDATGQEGDRETSIYFYTLAAEQGFCNAQFNLGEIFFRNDGKSGNSGNLQNGIYYFQMAADQGDEEAHYRLGWIYEHGKGTKQCLRQAIKHYILSKEPNKLSHIFSGEEGLPYKVIADSYLAEEWPTLRHLLHEGCTKALVELFMVIRNISMNFPLGIPVELCFLMMKRVIVVWPESHYVTRVKEGKEGKEEMEIK